MTRLRLRRGLVAMAACLAAAVSGCGILDKEPTPDITTGCVECVTEVSDLVEAVEGLDEVRKVRGTHRTIRGDGHLSITVDLAGKDIVSADVQALFDAVARAAWESGVNPLDDLFIDGVLRNGYTETNGYSFGADRDLYEDRWGPRPAGSVWSPVEEERDDDAEGCEVDGCREIMRDIAREVSALPGVEAVVKSVFYPDTPTSSTSADVTVLTDGTDVMDQVAEIVWRARVWPIMGIHVTADAQDGEFPDSTSYFVDPDTGQDHDRLEQLWGPRPVEE